MAVGVKYFIGGRSHSRYEPAGGDTDGSQAAHHTTVEVVITMAATPTAHAIARPTPSSRPASIAATPGHRLRVADLPATPAYVGLARALLKDWLREHDCTDDAVLLTSETVTNAVRHGSTADGSGVVRLVVRWLPGRVYVSVTDDGAGPSVPRLAHADVDAVSGRGLGLVEAVAARWGDHRPSTIDSM